MSLVTSCHLIGKSAGQNSCFRCTDAPTDAPMTYKTWQLVISILFHFIYVYVILLENTTALRGQIRNFWVPSSQC